MIDATPILRAYAAYRRWNLEKQDPAATQERTLLSLVRRAQNTGFGRDHGFAGIRSVTGFQDQVPIRTYDQMWNDYWKDHFPILTDCTWPGTIPFFAVSSGTSSGTTKYIPYTHEMTRSNTKAAVDLLVHHVTNRPGSKLLGGNSFMLGGSTDLVERAPKIFSGDLSGIATKTMTWWARQRSFPPAELALLKNWEEKIDLLAKHSFTSNIRLLGGVPSWMLILFDRLSSITGGAKIKDFYPNLEMLVHGGVNFSPYYERFKSLLEGSHAELREVYPASEGFIAVGDRAYGEGLRLILDHGIFFEFIPMEELDSPNPTRHWLGNIQTGINYALVMSTCAGAWGYLIGDTVRFVDTYPPRLLVTGRTSYYLSAFGEHVIAEELDDALSTAATKTGLTVSDYSVGPVYPKQPGELGGHLYVIEFAGKRPEPAELEQFTTDLDQRLSQRNEDYEAHRAEGFGLRAPQVLVAPSGAFAAWMKSRGKLGGQHKVPRIIMKQELFDNLIGFVEGLH